MIGASKILTVSYGTFSCTLEGFDDSFGTMKAIAEYFRDLAEKDRYFGAEPPVPDAAMLAHIAQTEINQPVEAKVDGNDVVLKRALVDAKTDPVPETEAEVEAEVEAEAETEAETKELPGIPDHITPDIEIKAAETSSEDDIQEDESVAAKLKRIRAAVAQNENKVAATFIEDQHADALDSNDPVAEPARIPQDVQERPEPQRDSDDQAVLDAFAALENDENDALDQDAPDQEETAASEQKPEQAPAVGQDDENTAEEMSGIDAILRAEINAAVDEAEPETMQEDLVEAKPKAPAAPVVPTRPRIVKMKKDEYEAAKQNGTLDAAIKGATENPAPLPLLTSLSPEDEAELLNELNSLEQDMGKSEPVAPIANKPSAKLADGGGEDEAAVARLMDETNAQLEEPEGSRRRSAISHLKAAVAATVADRKINPFASKTDGDDAKPYRSDLADVVRPRRPKAGGKANESATPLVLVSEQRIDEPDRGTNSRVQPRRVAAQPAVKQSQPSNNGFSEFASKMGVTGMVDIMEAAAAYAQYSEGHPSIGRPYLMRLAAQFIGNDGFSREEGLRAFGELLRQDKIIKVKRGQFAIAETTRFKPMSNMAVG